MLRIMKIVIRIRGFITKLFKESLRDFVKQFIPWFLVFFLSIMLYLMNTGKLPSNYSNRRIAAVVQAKLGSQYDAKILQANLTGYGDESLIIFANDKQVSDPDICSGNVKNPPVMEIYEKRDHILFDFSIPYKKVFDFRPIVKDSTQLWLYNYQVLDLDNDGRDEVILQMMATACGSGGTIYNFIFSNVDGEYKLIESLPPVGYTPNCSNTKCINETNAEWFAGKDIVINSTNKQEFNVYSTTNDHYLSFNDIDKDGKPEFIFAHPNKMWDDECHHCPHIWLIGVYKYNGKEFIIDNNWNSGLFYQTKDKIDLDAALGYVNIPTNSFGLQPQFLNKDEVSQFYYGSESTSEILKIVREKYNK